MSPGPSGLCASIDFEGVAGGWRSFRRSIEIGGLWVEDGYQLLDSGDGRKLERFGPIVLSRPCEQARWRGLAPDLWDTADASFDRESGWRSRDDARLPPDWDVVIGGIRMRLALTPAGQVGVFPETRGLWPSIATSLTETGRNDLAVLNLFAYSGAATIAAARTGCSLCHVDSSKSVVARARENASLNGLGEAPIRWIVDDAPKFMDREIRRGRRYDAIILDPPSYGHGVKGEPYKLAADLGATLERCAALLSSSPVFVLLTSHTRGVTPDQLESLLRGTLDRGVITSGEMLLTGGEGVRPVPSGIWSRWAPE